jgi:hypothetical protein
MFSRSPELMRLAGCTAGFGRFSRPLNCRCIAINKKAGAFRRRPSCRSIQAS